MKSMLVLVLLAGCLQSHGSGVQKLANSDCYTCHQANYEGTTQAAAMDPAVPDHLSPTNVGTYNQQCGDCHNTTTWYGHPEKLFNIATGSGKHADIQCDACHLDSTNNAGDAHGANTLCATCHFASEVVGGQTIVDDHIKHPDAIFPQNHQHNGVNWACTDCHTGPTPTTFDGYTNPPAGFTTQNFCLSCHPDGRKSNTSDAPCAPCHKARGVRVHNLSDGDPSGCLNCHPGGGGGGN